MITVFDYITYSKDKELICTINKNIINIYNRTNFYLLFKLNLNRIGLSGEITKAKLFFNTQVIAFSIIESHTDQFKKEGLFFYNYEIKSHSLIIYNLKDYEIIGKIKMKNFVEISDFLITKSL